MLANGHLSVGVYGLATTVSGAFWAAVVVLVPGLYLQYLQADGMPLWGTAWALAVGLHLIGHWRLWWSMVVADVALAKSEPLPIELWAGRGACQSPWRLTASCGRWRRAMPRWQAHLLAAKLLLLTEDVAASSPQQAQEAAFVWPGPGDCVPLVVAASFESTIAADSSSDGSQSD